MSISIKRFTDLFFYYLLVSFIFVEIQTAEGQSKKWIPSNSPEYKEDPAPEGTTDCDIHFGEGGRITTKGMVVHIVGGMKITGQSEGMALLLDTILDEGSKLQVIPRKSDDRIDIAQLIIPGSEPKEEWGVSSFFVNSGKIQIINSQPKFIRNGIFVLKNFFRYLGTNYDAKVKVSVWRNSSGEYKRTYEFLLNNNDVGIKGDINQLKYEVKSVAGKAVLRCVNENPSDSIKLPGGIELLCNTSGLLELRDRKIEKTPTAPQK